MSKYKYLYLVWLLPAWFVFLSLQQTLVYFSVIDTYENGTSYTAEVVEFELKQIAAQTNGYAVLRFTTDKGAEIQKKISLPVEIAASITQYKSIPIRYLDGAYVEIVMISSYKVYKDLVLTNIGMAIIGLLITLGIAAATHRFARKKLGEEEVEFVIERVDQDE